ncbi:MAG: type II toxin-antitoxin system VapC family toxin [Cyanobacteria bacterium J06643_13]
MTQYLLDTNVISELRKKNRCNPGVKNWYATIDEQEIYLSVLVIGELRCGVELIRRCDPDAASYLDVWLKKIILEYSDQIFPITQEIAETWGAMNVPDPISTVDGLLAATAKVHNCTLVTRNTKDIMRCDVVYYNPFL